MTLNHRCRMTTDKKSPSPFVPLIIEEETGIQRQHEPVTLGIPFPQGLIKEGTPLLLTDSNSGLPLPLQYQPLAKWHDGSVKWLLIDTQVSVGARERKDLHLSWGEASENRQPAEGINTVVANDAIKIDTTAACFVIDTAEFKPFDQVIVNGRNILDSSRSATLLIDEHGTTYNPIIRNAAVETSGNLRTTIKIDGEFRAEEEKPTICFGARLHFFYQNTTVKLEFSLHNHNAALHPGGLWDLGDPGSFLFKELAIFVALHNSDEVQTHLEIIDEFDAPDISSPAYSEVFSGIDNLLVYQDSSGGENWQSHNHVNRNGEIKTSFRGFRVSCEKKLLRQGLRAVPSISLSNGSDNLSVAVEHFWQNFPKALEVTGTRLNVKLFPVEFDDVYELQGGERKCHTIYFDFPAVENGSLLWTISPLVVRSTPQWYEDTAAIPYLIARPKDSSSKLWELIDKAIEGENSFFARREIIDEYGWRNFGELYADHEAVGHEGPSPLVSHYNNQYDGIYGFLMQYMSTGDARWLKQADQLCRHVRDIDIYHTDKDRPEYSHGLFWHTEHYIDAQTATHRCFSRKHAGKRDLNTYGGGPSLSHNYATGLLYHYYLTGDHDSKEAAEELTVFVDANIRIQSTICSKVYSVIKKVADEIKKNNKPKGLVDFNKVYTLDGPGRASGNALSTLLDGFCLTNDQKYLDLAEHLIRQCISKNDKVESRDLLDIENRWMYTVFLQALGKYLEIKEEKKQFDQMWYYGHQSLTHYANWMVDHELPYFEQQEKLEFPNETWAAQELRKCNVLMSASKYSKGKTKKNFLKKAAFFQSNGLSKLSEFNTSKSLTRPLALLMQNCIMASLITKTDTKQLIFLDLCNIIETYSQTIPDKHQAISFISNISLKQEILYLKWRMCNTR